MEIDVEQVIDRLKKSRDLDLSGYARSTLTRRITYFMGLKKITTTAELADILVKNDAMFQDFLDKLTINVTEFFRDPPFWDRLLALLKADHKTQLNIWPAGCSIGCEPYTLTMLLTENRLPFAPIRATDMDKGALEKAKKGVYGPSEIKNVPAEYMKYFTLQDGLYLIDPSIKKKVQFEQHNLLQDEFPASEMDLILCRNVVIYFGHDVHDYLWAKFSQALKPGGILFVGASEIIFDPSKYGLSLVTHGFYRKQ
jgi:chemotaxis protein methyltransferase CheR